MGITTPTIYTCIHDEEVARNRPANESTLLKLVRNYNYLSDLMPPGTIVLYHVNMLGMPALDASVWQLCNGGEITHPLSPLRSIGGSHRFTPAIADHILRHAPASTGNGVGGNHTFGFKHNHGGSTTGRSSFSGDVLGEGDEKRSPRDHTHPIGASRNDGGEFPESFTIDYPPWYKLAPYMKIR